MKPQYKYYDARSVPQALQVPGAPHQAGTPGLSGALVEYHRHMHALVLPGTHLANIMARPSRVYSRD